MRKQQSQLELGNILEKTGSIVGYYETGKSEPTLKSLMKLAEHFDVSLDNLIYKDLSEEKSIEGNPGKNLANENSKQIEFLEKLIESKDNELKSKDSEIETLKELIKILKTQIKSD